MPRLADNDIERYAMKAARRYISRYGETKHIDRDDAFSIACLKICRHPEYDERFSEAEICAYFVERGYFAIVHEYRKITKKHKDRQIQVVPLDDLEDVLESPREEEPSEDHRADLQTWIDKLNDKEAAIIRSVIAGRVYKDIAQEFGISCGRITQILKKFQEQVRVAIALKENFRYVGETGGNTDARALFPLFFQ